MHTFPTIEADNGGDEPSTKYDNKENGFITAKGEKKEREKMRKKEREKMREEREREGREREREGVMRQWLH